MRKSVRVNLSVPLDVDVVLTELAGALRVSKASLVMVQIGRGLPYWRNELSRLRRGEVSGEVSGRRASVSRLTSKEREQRQWNAKLERDRVSKEKDGGR